MVEEVKKPGKKQTAADRRGMGEIYGNKNAITKKVPTNPKYAHVKSVVSTGSTAKNIQIISDNLVAKRKGENFGRIKGSTLAKLLTEVQHAPESIFGLIENDENKENQDTVSVAPSDSASCVTYTTQMLGINENTKFILLDLRDTDDHKKFHIKESISFPGPNILRDKIFANLLRFKNIPDKIIVAYSAEERTGIHYAKILHEKGFDNVFLLSGGMEQFLQEHRDHVEGTDVPEEVKKTAEKKMRTTGMSTKMMKSTVTSGFK